MKALWITFGVVAAVIVITVIAAISIRNGLIERDEQVRENWSQIETQLQRRSSPKSPPRAVVFSRQRGRQPRRKPVRSSKGSSGGCSPSPKTIRTSRQARTSCAFRTNWPEPRTGSASPAPVTIRLCGKSTPPSASSPVRSSCPGSDSSRRSTSSRPPEAPPSQRRLR